MLKIYFKNVPFELLKYGIQGYFIRYIYIYKYISLMDLNVYHYEVITSVLTQAFFLLVTQYIFFLSLALNISVYTWG